MADHLREQILDAVQTALTGLATTGANVYRLRMFPIAAAAIPCLNIVQGEDISSQEAWNVQDSELTVRVEVRVAGSGNIDQVVNQIEAEVVTALEAGTIVAVPGVRRIWRTVTSEPEIDENGDTQLALASILFKVQYRTEIQDPTAAG